MVIAFLGFFNFLEITDGINWARPHEKYWKKLWGGVFEFYFVLFLIRTKKFNLINGLYTKLLLSAPVKKETLINPQIHILILVFAFPFLTIVILKFVDKNKTITKLNTNITRGNF